MNEFISLHDINTAAQIVEFLQIVPHEKCVLQDIWEFFK